MQFFHDSNAQDLVQIIQGFNWSNVLYIFAGKNLLRWRSVQIYFYTAPMFHNSVRMLKELIKSVFSKIWTNSWKRCLSPSSSVDLEKATVLLCCEAQEFLLGEKTSTNFPWTRSDLDDDRTLQHETKRKNVFVLYEPLNSNITINTTENVFLTNNKCI